MRYLTSQLLFHSISHLVLPMLNGASNPAGPRARPLLVIICTIYGKNPSRTVDATERTRFSSSRPNDLENIGQGQRSLMWHTHSDANDDLCQIWRECKQNCRLYFQGESRKIRKISEKFKFYNFVINLTHDTPSNGSDYLWQIWKWSI